MRIPLSISILLSLGVVAGTWWWGTRGRDFMSPPSDSQLEAIRTRTLQTLPATDQPRDAVSAPASTSRPVTQPHGGHTPVLNTTELSQSPRLGEYRKHRKHGSGYLIELARLLEANGYPQRACLAWERVLDSTRPDAEQSREAEAAIRRLRPSLPAWNTQPDEAIEVTLHAGTNRTTAVAIQPALDGLARKIEHASSGILKVSVDVAAGPDTPGAAESPVALWFSGKESNTGSTELASISVSAQSDIQQELARTAFTILRTYLAREVALSAPAAISSQEAPGSAIEQRITRLAWREFGNMLNLTP